MKAKRFLSLFLAFVMVVGILPLPVRAAGHSHYSCGLTSCSDVRHGHGTQITYDTEWSGTKYGHEFDSNAYVVLTDDTTSDFNIVVNEGVIVYLCLNGKTLKLNKSTAQIVNNGVLHICDCAGGGEIVSRNTGTGTIVNAVDGSLYIYGGTIENTDPTFLAYCITNSAPEGTDTTVRMYGGTVKCLSGTGIYSLGTYVDICGGTIDATTAIASNVPSTSTPVSVSFAGSPVLNGTECDIDLGDGVDVYAYVFTAGAGAAEYVGDDEITIDTFDCVVGEDIVYNVTDSNADKFKVVKPTAHILKNVSGTLVLAELHTHGDGFVFDAELFGEQKADIEITESKNIVLTDDVTFDKFSPTIQIGDYENPIRVKLCLNGHKISMSDKSYSRIIVTKNAILDIYDCQGTGVIESNDGIGTLHINGGGDVNLQSGTIKNTGDGVGVLVQGTGKFHMSDGTVSSAEDSGIYSDESGSGAVNIYGGTISGGKYGIGINNEAKVYINDAPAISGGISDIGFDGCYGGMFMFTKYSPYTGEKLTIKPCESSTDGEVLAWGVSDLSMFELVGFEEGYKLELEGGGQLILVVPKADGEVTITSDISKVYDGEPVSAPTYDSLSEGLPTIEYKKRDADDSTYTGIAPVNAGLYTVRVTVPADENYKEAFATKDFRIGSLRLPNGKLEQKYPLTYNGTAQQPEINVAYGETLGNVPYDVKYLVEGSNGQYSYEIPSFTDAGTYEVTYRITAENYSSIVGLTFEVTVDPKPVTPYIVGDTDKVFDGTTDVSGLTIAFTGALNGDVPTASANISYDSTDAGDRTVTATDIVIDSQWKNYVSSQATVSTSGNITPYVTDVQIDDTYETSYDYTGQAIPVPERSELVLGGLPAGVPYEDVVSFTWYDESGNPLSGAPVDAGTYTLKAEIETSNNFVGSYDEKTVVINPIAGAVTNIYDISKVYDGEPVSAPTFDSLSEGAVTIEYKTSSLNDFYYSTEVPVKPGNYTVRVTVAAAGNYKEASATKDFTIDRAAITNHSVVQIGEYVYNGTEQTISVDANPVTMGGQEARYMYRLNENELFSSEVPKFKDAGTYTVYYNVNAPYHNYSLGSFEVTIGKAELAPKISGAAVKDHDGNTAVTPGQLSIAFDGAMAGDAPTATASYAYDNANAGTGKTVTATNIVLDPAWTNNYELGTTTASANTGVINKITPTVKIKTDYVREFSYTGSGAIAPSASEMELLNVAFNELTFEWEDNDGVLAAAPVNVGAYKVTAKFAGDINRNAASDYIDVVISKGDHAAVSDKNINITNGAVRTGEITLADLFGSTPIPSGAYIADITPPQSQVIMEDVSEGADNKIAYSSLPNPASTTGTDSYDVIISSDNYNDFAITLSFTAVDKTAVTITGVEAATGLVYNGNAHVGYTGTPTSEYTGEYEIKYTGTNYDSAEAPVNAGDYTVTFKVPDSNDDYIGEVSVSFSIAKANVTVTADNVNAYVDDTAPELSGFTVTGLVGGDTFTEPTLAYESTPDMTEAGTCTIVISGGTLTNRDNYDVTYVNGTLNITNRASSSGSSSAVYYTIKFDTNDGSSISPVSKLSGNTVDLSKYTTTRDGFEFTGWYSDSKLENKITSVKLTGHVTVYAGWKSTAVTPDPEAVFADVKANDWFAKDVAYVYENGFMNGTADAVFDPLGTTNRSMIITILHRLANEPNVTYAGAINGVSPTDYYFGALNWAADLGIMLGDGKGNFALDSRLTREQIATLLWRYATMMGVDVSVGEDTNILSYNDAFDVSEYAMSAMQWACGEGIITGKPGGMLDPQGNASRAEMAAIIHRFVELMNK